MLDKKDMIIFENLLHNCRISTSKLAKLTKLTQPAVHYRIKQLEIKGFIEKYDIILNYSLLNIATHFYFVSVPEKERGRFENELKNDSGVIALISLIHVRNYYVMTMMNEKEQKSFESKILAFKYERYVLKDLQIIPYSIFNIPIKEKILHEKKKTKIDQKDIKIIHELSDGGARKPLLEVCHKTGLSWDIVNYRFKKLKNSGFFAMFVAQPNIQKFTIQTDMILIQTTSDCTSVSKILTKLEKFPYVCELQNKTYLTQLLSTSMKEYKETLLRLYTELGDSIESIVIYNTNRTLFTNRYDLNTQSVASIRTYNIGTI